MIQALFEGYGARSQATAARATSSVQVVSFQRHRHHLARCAHQQPLPVISTSSLALWCLSRPYTSGLLTFKTLPPPRQPHVVRKESCPGSDHIVTLLYSYFSSWLTVSLFIPLAIQEIPFPL